MSQSRRKQRVLIVSAFPPPYGGISVLAEKLYECMLSDGVVNVLRLNTVLTHSDAPTFGARLFRLLHYPLFLWRLFNHMLKSDIVYRQTASNADFFLHTLPSVLLARIMNKRCVVIYHSSNAVIFFRKHILRRMAIRILRLASLIVTTSTAIKKDIESATHLSVALVPNFTNNSPGSREQHHLHCKFPVYPMVISKLTAFARGRKKILCVAGLYPAKGIDVLLHALYELKRVRKDFCVFLVGRGLLRNFVDDYIRKHDLSECVLTLGFLPEGEKLIYLDACDLFVLPSRNENSPIALLEALQFGLPIVATDVGGVADILRSPNVGILVEKENPGALSQALSMALDTAYDKDVIRHEGSLYTWEKLNPQYYRIILGLA